MLQGDTVGGNANDIQGCFALSNPITVTRSVPNGGTISGGPFSFCVDGQADTIATDAISLSGNVGSTSQWVITDTSGTILGLPPHFSNVNFDEAGVGVCLIWHLSAEGMLQGDTVGGNANDIQGCFALSNPITVNRDSSGEACPTQSVMGIAILNEINANGNVELTNIGDDTINVSTYFLCNFPNYIRMDTLNIICGSLIIAPGGFVTVDASSLNFTSADGELGLYEDDSFSSASSILDYVEWGSSGHQRSAIAANAGIWTNGTSVNGFASNQSLQYDGDGDDTTDWVESDPTECEENNTSGLQGNEAKVFNFKIAPNPVSDMATLKFTNKSESTRGIMYIYDQTGMIRMQHLIAVGDGMENTINFSQLESGIYFIRVFSSELSYYDKFIVH